MAGRTPQSQDKFLIRLPDGMRDRIRVAAELSGRTMTSEIIATLEEKYPPPSDEDLKQAIKTFDLRIEQAEPSKRARLHELRGQLVAELYYEPLDDAE